MGIGALDGSWHCWLLQRTVRCRTAHALVATSALVSSPSCPLPPPRTHCSSNLVTVEFSHHVPCCSSQDAPFISTSVVLQGGRMDAVAVVGSLRPSPWDEEILRLVLKMRPKGFAVLSCLGTTSCVEAPFSPHQAFLYPAGLGKTSGHC